MKNNPRTLAIGEKLEQTANQFTEELTEDIKDTLSKFGELEFFCLDIAGARRSRLSQKEAGELIKNYIKTALSVGIQISYIPN